MASQSEYVDNLIVAHKAELEQRDAHFVRLSNVVTEMQQRLNEVDEKNCKLQMMLGAAHEQLEEREAVIRNISRIAFGRGVYADAIIEEICAILETV